MVTGADNAGNTTAAPALTFTNDSTAPTGGQVEVDGQFATSIGGGVRVFSSSTAITISNRIDYRDSGSGLASSVLTMQTRTLSNGSCGSVAGPFATAVVVTGTTTPTGIVTGWCYDFVLTGTDNVGNVASILVGVKVDTTAPTVPVVTPAAATGNTFISGTTVYINPQAGKSGSFSVSATSTDGESGIQKINFPALTGFSTGGGDDATSPYSSGTYSWSGAVGASGAQTVTATNNSGLTASSSFTVTPDTTPPDGGGALVVNGQTATGGGTSGYSSSTGFAIGMRTNYTDSGSGIASSVLTVQSFALSSSDGIVNGTCAGSPSGPFSTATTVSGTTQPGGIVTGFCYVYTLTGTDNVGNTVSISTTVKVDTTAPTAPVVTPSAATGNTFVNGATVYINAQAGKSGSFQVSATSTDGDSGIQKINFPALAGFSSGGGDDATSPYSSGSYSWSGAVGASGAQTVTATDNATLTNSSTFTVTPDTTAPTVPAPTVTAGYYTSLSAARDRRDSDRPGRLGARRQHDRLPARVGDADRRLLRQLRRPGLVERHPQWRQRHDRCLRQLLRVPRPRVRQGR